MGFLLSFAADFGTCSVVWRSNSRAARAICWVMFQRGCFIKRTSAGNGGSRQKAGVVEPPKGFDESPSTVKLMLALGLETTEAILRAEVKGKVSVEPICPFAAYHALRRRARSPCKCARKKFDES